MPVQILTGNSDPKSTHLDGTARTMSSAQEPVSVPFDSHAFVSHPSVPSLCWCKHYLGLSAPAQMCYGLMSEARSQEMLLNRTSALLSSLLRGLDGVDLETRKRIMESCGEACARSDGDLGIAERIAAETRDEAELLRRADNEIPWCGTWIRDGDRIKATCVKCGCPLVRNKVMPLSGTLCYCSRGWVKAIFETLLRRLVKVELEESIGLGGKACRFVVQNAGDN